MTKYDKLKTELRTFTKELENVHKLASLLNNFCNSKKDDDILYEISYAIELIEKKLGELGYRLYLMTNDRNKCTCLNDIFSTKL